MEKLFAESQADMKSESEKTAVELCSNLETEVGIITTRNERIEAKIALNVKIQALIPASPLLL